LVWSAKVAIAQKPSAGTLPAVRWGLAHGLEDQQSASGLTGSREAGDSATLPYLASVKLTCTWVSTSTGSPFNKYGLYFHCLTASMAAGASPGCPLIS
jgi:hypothetical protein